MEPVRSRIARYELVRRCDDGALGEEFLGVFRADSGLLSACRLLVVSPEPDLDREEAVDRLRPLMALDHPGIVRMIDAGWIEDQLFVAYDLRPSRSLAAVVERHLEFRGPLHPALAVEICASVARSLQHAHLSGRTEDCRAHGGIEPETVIIGADGQVMLRHFGLQPVLGAGRDEAGRGTAEGDARSVYDLLAMLAIPDDEGTLRSSSGLDTILERFALILSRSEMGWRRSSSHDAASLLSAVEEIRSELGQEADRDHLAATLAELFGDELSTEAEELARLVASTALGDPGPSKGSAPPPPPEASARQWTPRPGEVLAERYRLVRLLGTGRMSEVFEAERLGSGQRVALKILAPHLSLSPGFWERLRGQATMAAASKHPSIVGATDFGSAPDGRLWHAMDLVEGPSLAEQIREEGAIAQVRAIRIMLQVCDALGAAHEHGVVHGSLKPANVLLTRDETGTELARLLDFGMAQDAPIGSDRAVVTSQVVGTPGYMAPEQIRGGPTDGRSDVYSAGITLYEALTGQLPFVAGTVVEVFRAHLEEAPVPPRERADEHPLHPLLQEVVLTAMAKAPEDRYQSIADMEVALRDAFEAILGGPPPADAASPEDEPSGTKLPRIAFRGLEHLRMVDVKATVPDLDSGRGPLSDVDIDGLIDSKESSQPPDAAEEESVDVTFDGEEDLPEPDREPRERPQAETGEGAEPEARDETGSGADAAVVPPPAQERKRPRWLWLLVALVAAGVGGALATTQLCQHGRRGAEEPSGRPPSKSAVPETEEGDRGKIAPASLRPGGLDAGPPDDGSGAGDLSGEPDGAVATAAEEAARRGRLAEAEELLRKGRFSRAKRAFSKLLADRPDAPAALAGLGEIELRRGRAREALPLLERAVAGQPEESRYRLLLAKALVRVGRRRDARQQWLEVLSQDPEDREAQRFLRRFP